MGISEVRHSPPPRQLGEILKRMAANGERVRGRPEKESRGATPSTLSDLGIPRRRASRAMQAEC
jgi:hypothetical protein